MGLQMDDDIERKEEMVNKKKAILLGIMPKYNRNK
jgi:hypothetical protein